MKLSPREQQILDEIERGLRTDAPDLAVGLTRFKVRPQRSVWGWVTVLVGLAAFLAGAISASALPIVGVAASVAGFPTMLFGVTLLFPSDSASAVGGASSAPPRQSPSPRLDDPPATEADR